MKKIGILLLALMMLVGCTQEKKESTFMITKDSKLYALYNQDGEKLTDFVYKTFEEIDDVGYIVTNDKNQKGLISLEGEEIIAFGTYETLEAVSQMLYATKKVEAKETENNDQYIHTNLYVLNSQGGQLYSASENIGIKKSGLPLIYDKKNKDYIVLYKDGKELYKGKDYVNYANQDNDSQSVVIGYKANEKFFYFDRVDEKKNLELTFKEVGNFQILAQDSKGVVLNDSAAKSMIYVDLEKGLYYQNSIAITKAYFDEVDNIILTAPGKTFVYPVGKVPVLMTSYYMTAKTYVSRLNVVYGPHTIYKENIATGDLENCQLYPEAYHINSEIYPVYQKNKGYQYYNFDCKLVIDTVYLEAHPFDANTRAIVKTNEDGYSLIDGTGAVITKEYYNEIKYIGSSYYVVYNKDRLFGIVDVNGQEVLPIEYTSLPENPIVTYDKVDYLTLNKNGRSYVYDVEDDMNVIFSQEGNVILNEEGYFSVGNEYYTFDGKMME